MSPCMAIRPDSNWPMVGARISEAYGDAAIALGWLAGASPKWAVGLDPSVCPAAAIELAAVLLGGGGVTRGGLGEPSIILGVRASACGGVGGPSPGGGPGIRDSDLGDWPAVGALRPCGLLGMLDGCRGADGVGDGMLLTGLASFLSPAPDSTPELCIAENPAGKGVLSKGPCT